MKLRVATFLVLLAVVLVACSGSAGPQIKVEQPWVRAASAMGDQSMQGQAGEGMTSGGEMGEHMGSGANSAAYMILQNSGNEADQLIKAESDVAESVEIHISEMKDGVMSMHPVDGVDIPANGQAELKPGSFHIMLIGIKQDLVVGDKVTLKLTFANSGTLDIVADVKMP